MDLLVAEDLLLLLLDDTTGTTPSGANVDVALGGAMLVDLALAGAVEIPPKSGMFDSPRVTPLPGREPADPLLAGAYRSVQAKQMRPTDAVNRLGKQLRRYLAERLAARGILRRQEGRILGLLPRTTWPAADSSHEEQVRRTLYGVLVQGLTPDARTAGLIGLLHAIGYAHKVVPRESGQARTIKARAKQIAEGDPAAKAVKSAVDAAVAASSAAVMVAVSASAGGAAGGS